MWLTVVAVIAAVLFAALLIYLYSRFGDLIANPSKEDLESAQKDKIIATDLHVPWSIDFLPDGTILTTQRNGLLTVIDSKGRSFDIAIQGTTESGEGGLLGLALHPDFATNNFIYLYYTAKSKDKIVNRVVRCILKHDSISIDKLIVNNIPGGTNHNGGRIAFGPDGYLYITTGDAEQENLAQDVNSLAGKILRVEDDGSIPTSNPFRNAVYSYGHRNPQGVAWDNQGGMWSTEHGRSGLQSGYDELNYIERGKNYGWPIIQGDQEKEGMVKPVIQSGPTTTWAPASIAFKDGFLYFGGLLGQALYKVQVQGAGKVGPLQITLKNVYGRIRAVAVSPDGQRMFISTSNGDGRGLSKPGDDKIIELNV